VIHMRSFVYPAALIPEAKGFTVRFPDLPDAITGGEDRSDALLQATDCLEEAIAVRISDGLDIPEPSAVRRKQVPIPLPAPLAAKAALYLTIKDTGLSNLQLARKLGLDEKEIRRLLDPKHATKLSRIEDVLARLGKRITISLEDAA
jgi:antitoxin HicB